MGSNSVSGQILMFGAAALALATMTTTAGAESSRSWSFGPAAAEGVEATAPAAPAAPVAAAPATAGTAVDRIRAAGKLRVLMDTGEPPGSGTPPMYFKDASGAPDGFDMKVAGAVAAQLGGVKVEVVHAKYSELPERLVGGSDADVIISGYSPDDSTGVAFSTPYLDYGLCLVTTAGSDITNTGYLWGKPVGIFDDDAAAAAVNKLVKGYTELVRLEDGYWDQLLEGRFAGFIYDYPYAVAEINDYYAKNPKKAGAFRIAQFNLTDSHYAVGVRATEKDLLAAVNDAIDAWRQGEDYPATIKRYLSAGVAAPPAPKASRKVAVKAGDSLSGIAKRELGSGDRWKDIWELNKERFPNPHLIAAGDDLVLPEK